MGADKRTLDQDDVGLESGFLTLSSWASQLRMKRLDDLKLTPFQ